MGLTGELEPVHMAPLSIIRSGVKESDVGSFFHQGWEEGKYKTVRWEFGSSFLQLWPVEGEVVGRQRKENT